jgi:hypothetical protein
MLLSDLLLAELLLMKLLLAKLLLAMMLLADIALFHLLPSFVFLLSPSSTFFPLQYSNESSQL